MAQVMMLIGLLLLAFLARRAVFLLQNWWSHRRQGGGSDGHRGARIDDRKRMEQGADPQIADLAALKQQRDNLEARVAVLEKLLQASDDPAALPPPAASDPSPPKI